MSETNLTLLALLQGQFGPIARCWTLFLALDFFGSLVAFILDRQPLTSLLVIPIQRFVYRPILYYITLKAVFAMLRGHRQGWNKLTRTNTVSAPTHRHVQPSCAELANWPMQCERERVGSSG